MELEVAGSHGVSRETLGLLARYGDLVRHEARHQNLIAASTLEAFDQRHIADCAQLVPLLAPGRVLDLGSGAGLPGIVLAILTEHDFTLVEPRRKRAEFLQATVNTLQLSARVTVVARRAQTLQLSGVATVTARAVAALDEIFAMAAHLATPRTRWVLPKGRTASAELEQARRSWHGGFRLVPSLTDPDAAIVVAEGVRRRDT